jgi:hypothetical protein
MLSAIEGMLREVVPSHARYAWFIDAEGWAYVFEGSPPSDLTYLIRTLAWETCDAGKEVQGIRIHPTPTLGPFEVRIHLQTLGPLKPQAVLICALHPEANLSDLEEALAGIRPRLGAMVIEGLWIVPPEFPIEHKFADPPSRA